MTQGFVNPYTYAVSAPTVTTYTSGSGTYTVPSGVQFLIVQMVGGGGGGAGSGTSGQGNGSNGGNTTFGSATANGGNAGLPSGGTGGGASGGTINLSGGFGGFGGGLGIAGPTGGSSFFAGGGAGGNNAPGAGSNAPTNTGAGGGGAGGSATVQSSYAGGAGGYVQWIITSPSATYSYGVGAGGAGGAAGASGSAGGNGAAGIIIIYEYYQTLGIPTTLTLPLPVSNGGTGLSAGGPAFSAYASSSQSITANTLTLVTLGAELFDTNNNFASSRFTPTVAGYYQINGIVRGTGTTMTLLQASIYKNGSAYNNIQINTNAPVYSTQTCISEVIYLNGSTDYVELYGAVYCASGASFNFSDSAITSHFNGCYLRGA
jgi:hypothetical protein